MVCLERDDGAMKPDESLAAAVLHHQAGRLDRAEALYREILLADPRHADANHNLGVLALQAGKPADALPCLLAALDANPGKKQFWASYVDALMRAGWNDAARAVDRKSVV